MSTSVTVSRNPTSMRRGKLFFSDLENIKKSEREHRRRLRSEQVREQSRALSRRILERTRQIEKEKLERDSNLEMRLERDRRLMELHRRYQDIENIGYAHENALKQPDVQEIKKMEEQKNKAMAKARGTEALQQLQETNKILTPLEKHQQRLLRVRNVENERSSMVANLPKKACKEKSDNLQEVSENENVIKAPLKKRIKCILSKKSPVKKIKETKVHSSFKRTPRAFLSKSDEVIKQTPKCTFTTSVSKSADKASPSRVPKFSNPFREQSKTKDFESDDNEPRKTIPVTSSVSSMPEKGIGYNKENYPINSSSDLSSICTTSSSSISDDSSYFSDTAYKASTVKKTPLLPTSPVTSKVDLYDYKTRQRKAYERPSGLVERLNVKNQPSAEDLAQEVIQQENKKLEDNASKKKNLEQRTQDALLREKIRRDYQALLKNLDLLSKEERKLKANKITDLPSEQIFNPSKISENQTRRQKKMDRAFESILRSFQEPVTTNNWTERPITITPQNYIHSETIPSTVWRAPPYMDDKRIEQSSFEEDDDIAHKRKISELLLKIETLKKRLLQEYGADLPDDVFNISVRSLFNNSNLMNRQSVNSVPTTAPINIPTSAPSNVPTSAPKSSAPEIQVINMSGCGEPKVVRRVTTQNKKSGNAKTTTKSVSKQSTVETSTSTRDQQVQVELVPPKMKDEPSPKPMDPMVTIINPKHSDSNTSMCSDSSVLTDVVVGVNTHEITVIPKSRESSIRISKNSSGASSGKSKRYTTDKTPVKISFEQKSGSASFEVAGLLIDANKKKITILPRRKKTVLNSVMSSRSRKSHSLPGSRDNSPANKLSKSAPASQQSSPKKTPILQKLSPKKSLPSSHKIIVKKSPPARKCKSQETGEEEHKYRTQCTQVSIDSSTESSQLNYVSGTTTRTAIELGRLLKSFQTLTSKQTMTKIQDSSDASTTYASPPAAIAGSMINVLTRSTPILELLNNSLNHKLIQQVSPVSSPETPSPRTMRLPSNIRRSDKASKSLKFTSLIDRPVKTDFSDQPKTTCVNCKTISNDNKPIIPTKQISQTRLCTCKNPACNLTHDKSEDIPCFGLKNCPELLEKFEDLKNNCTERIASLTDSIQKLRNEQKGFELSVTTNEDTKANSKTSLNSKLSGRGEMNKLANSIEVIHAQLKKKLMESRQIISGERIKLSTSPALDSHAEKSPSISIDLSKVSSTSESPEGDVGKAKNGVMPSFDPTPKPKIVSNERVNIKLDRFRLGQTSRTVAGSCKTTETTTTTTTATTEAATVTVAGTASSAPDQNEEMVVEMLSKEILEQSKSLNNKSAAIDSLKDSDDSGLKSKQPVDKNTGEYGKSVNANEQNQSIDLDQINVSDYVPLLAGIPKIPRTLAKTTTNGRTRPPVTLISGPYRTEIVSPVHELSTIVEFDTPDTANKSQASNKSPSSKCRKKLPLKELVQSCPSVPTKPPSVKLTKCKPSVHVAPLPAHRSPQRSLNLSNRSISKNSDKSPRKFAEKSLDSVKSRKGSKCEIIKTNNSSDSLHTLPDVHIDHLQQSQDNADGNNEFRISEISELQSLPDENIDRLLISDLQEESKSKQEQNKGQITLSDSSSFSGLSGVSEIMSTPTSDMNLFKYPSSPEEMELALKKWGLGWAIPTLKKTREASALGSSSSSDVTPVNAAARLVSPVKKQQDNNNSTHEFPVISDVSSISISIKHANKSTEKSVLVKGRTSTPNRFSNTNTDNTVSTLESFSSDFNIVVPNESADMTAPNISFSNDKLG